MNTSCAICSSPSGGNVDSLLDAGTSLRKITDQTEWSRATITRHSRHRQQRALAAAASTSTIAAADLTTPDGVVTRYRELAVTCAQLGQLAATIHEPALVLRALRAEADLLDRIAPRIAPEQAAQERQLQIFRSIAAAARDTLDPEAAQRFAAQVNDDLRRQGLVRLETAS